MKGPSIGIGHVAKRRIALWLNARYVRPANASRQPLC